MPRSPKSPTPLSRPPTTAITARLVVRRVKDARFPDALFPVWRYHPFFTNTDLPVVAGRHHPPPARHHRNRVRRPDRRAAGAHPVGPFRRELRLDAVRGDRPQPAARRRRPGRRPPRRARGSTLRRKIVNIPARLARPQRRPILHLPTHWPWAKAWLPLWHNTIGHSPPLPATRLTTRRKARPEHTGKAGQTSDYLTLTPRQSGSTTTDSSHRGPSVDRG